MLVSLQLTSREVIEVEKSKTRRPAIKFNKMCFSARGRGDFLIMTRPLSGCQIKAKIEGISADILFVSVIAMVLSVY